MTDASQSAALTLAVLERAMLVPVLLALALLCWPSRDRWRSGPPVGKARAGRAASAAAAVLGAGSTTPVRHHRAALPLIVATVGAGVTGLLGTAAGLAAAIAAGTAGALLMAAGTARTEHRQWAALAGALSILTRDLRAGADPATAAESVAAAVPEGVARTLCADLAVAYRQGSRSLPARSGPPGLVAERLRCGLLLAHDYGVSWAELLAAVSDEVSDRRAAISSRREHVAGPRFSSYALAALPGFGLLLGSSMGAAPLTLLLAPGPGAVLLVVGVALLCAGLLWSARIVRT